jgi:sulfur-oxidizing protein SoxX
MRLRDPRVLQRYLIVLVLSSSMFAPAGVADAADNVARYRVVGDAIPEPLSPKAGDAQRGRALVVARDAANCVLCHAFPEASLRFFGDVGPSLDGVGRRLSAAQLRLRVADNLRVNPASAMPSYHRVDGLVNVAARYAGTPILNAAEVEDVVAYLATLQ